MERRHFLLGAGAAMTAGGGVARANMLDVPRTGSICFKVLRNGSPIGQHQITFTCNGGDLTAEINADLVVTLAGIPVFHYQGHAVERWTNGVFTRLDSQVNHNGTPLEVHAQAIAGGYAIQSTKSGDYTSTDPKPLLPLTYWNKRLLNAMLLNVETGRHYPAIANSPGWNSLPTANGGALVAQRFDLTGKLHLSLWYDQFNQWSGMEFHISGEETYQKYMA
ncbi:MAG: DUF6134 family protein [Acidocella sp.]|nr:DUF6134 family protein [Acidocella sp.]